MSSHRQSRQMTLGALRILGWSAAAVLAIATACSSTGQRDRNDPSWLPTCLDVGDCGGESPFCSGAGFCVECLDDGDCGEERLCASGGRCAECMTDADCPGDEPLCDGDGRCSECLADGDCGVAEPVCSPRGRCEPACETNADCEEGDVCDGTCVECASSTDCPGGEPLCDRSNARCVECLVDVDCGAASPYCHRGSCEECIQNLDCPAGWACDDELECFPACASDADCREEGEPLCDRGTGRCVECLDDDQCRGDNPLCVLGQCEECRVSADCPDGESCQENQCQD